MSICLGQELNLRPEYEAGVLTRYSGTGNRTECSTLLVPNLTIGYDPKPLQLNCNIYNLRPSDTFIFT
jgi:hypothetical protein